MPCGWEIMNFEKLEIKFDIQKLQLATNELFSQMSWQQHVVKGLCMTQIPGDPSSADGDKLRGVFWTKPDSSNMSQWDSVMSTGDTNTTSGGIFQIDYSGNNQLRFNTSGILLDLTLADGEWQHFVFTKEYITSCINITTYPFYYCNVTDQTLTYYKDGEYLDNKTQVSTRWDKLKIGLNRLGGSYWKGHIDDLRIYNRTLTADEVEELYESYE